MLWLHGGGFRAGSSNDPDHSPQDLLSIDTVFRPVTINTADARSEKREAPVYRYLLTWKSPVEGGVKGSFHGLDIPLVFDNIELGEHWTGSGEEAQLLADKMSAAWIHFMSKYLTPVWCLTEA